VTSIVTFFILTIIIAESAAQITPGVKQGDEFTYAFEVHWTSTTPSASPPSDLVNLNRTQWLKVTVNQVVGPIVLMNITGHIVNGTESTSQAWVNIETGEDYGGFGLVIPPNLNTNDVAYAAGNKSFTINATSTRTYAGDSRELVHFTANNTGMNDYAYVYDDIYWDRQTGALVEWYTERVSLAGVNEKTALHWTLTDSNVWVIPEFPAPLVLLILFMATLMLTIGYYRKPRRFMKQKAAYIAKTS
jgi:hypothetical protein